MEVSIIDCSIVAPPDDVPKFYDELLEEYGRLKEELAAERRSKKALEDQIAELLGIIEQDETKLDYFEQIQKNAADIREIEEVGKNQFESMSRNAERVVSHYQHFANSARETLLKFEELEESISSIPEVHSDEGSLRNHESEVIKMLLADLDAMREIVKNSDNSYKNKISSIQSNLIMVKLRMGEITANQAQKMLMDEGFEMFDIEFLQSKYNSHLKKTKTNTPFKKLFVYCFW